MSGSNGNGSHKSAWALPEDTFGLPPEPHSGPDLTGQPAIELYGAHAQQPAPQRSPGVALPMGTGATMARSPQWQRSEPVPFQPGPPMQMRGPGSMGPWLPERTGRSFGNHLGNPDIQNGGHMLGMSTLVVGLGSLLGARFGGWHGGLAGSLFGGSAVNAYRGISHAMLGTKEGDREALISGTYSFLAAGLAGYVLYRASTKTETTKNSDSPSCARTTSNGRRNCGIRPVI